MAVPLARLVFASVADRLAADDDADALVAILDAQLEAARRAWPGVAVEPTALARLIAQRLRGGGRMTEAVSELAVDDLYIACGCAGGDHVAIAQFEARYFSGVGPALARMQLDHDTIADIKQQIRERLFVGESPRIAAIAGNGDLGALVRIMAVRLALNLKRGDQRIDHDEELALAAIDTDADPELALLTAEHRAAFRTAIGDVIRSLESRQRSLLRLHLIQRLSIDEIGRTYRVHRATAARWLEQIRDQLQHDTKRLLTTRLGLADAELESFVRMLHSRIDVSFARLLAGTQ